ncbi:hypothetical protein Taro_021068 [Colocasia esculenta]|uniref:PetM of cytochrome b6/f complex subunit 7 n=1 Tax=Colocasia esculenta TaxID=4460 RepID=A0A843V1D8_COLES|nr:hypothetical protein [Colocasia esculenta]
MWNVLWISPPLSPPITFHSPLSRHNHPPLLPPPLSSVVPPAHIHSNNNQRELLHRHLDHEAGSVAMAALSQAALPAAASATGSGLTCSARRGAAAAACVGHLSSFGGLKAHNGIASLGLPECVDRSFARFVSSFRAASRGKGRRGGGGGALSATCNAAAEIFQIAAIINGLVLVGVAVGFVILRVEASLEESE